MSSSRVVCPYCGQEYLVTAEQWPEYEGQQVPCAGCNRAFLVSGTFESPVTRRTGEADLQAEASSVATMPPPLPTSVPAVPVADYWVPPQQESNGVATAGLVLGCCSLVLSILTGLPGIVCSILGIRKANRIGGRGLAVAIVGLVLSCFATLSAVLMAAIVIPQFTAASSMAKASSVQSIVQSVRSQLELYKLQHNDQYPTMQQMQNWSVLLGRTDVYGNVTPNGQYGPYLQMAPVNPLTQSSTIVPANRPVFPAGWVYDEKTGSFKAVIHKGDRSLLPAQDVVIQP